MSSGHLQDQFFSVVDSSAFTTELIEDLAAGRVAAVRVADFMPRAMCERTLKALEAASFDTYGKQRVEPAVMRFGVGVSDHRSDGVVVDGYWTAVDEARAAWLGLDLPADPFQQCRDALSAAWPGGVRVGSRGGREMGAGVAREANQGFRVHFDDAAREFSGNLLDSTLVAQFAFNLYLSVPEVGGETVVWRHRWQPSDEALRLPDSYGFSEEVVEGAESFELKPSVGEALLFDPRNYHAVRPSRNVRRIALGFAVGLTDTGELLTWG